MNVSSAGSASSPIAAMRLPSDVRRTTCPSRSPTLVSRPPALKCQRRPSAVTEVYVPSASRCRDSGASFEETVTYPPVSLGARFCRNRVTRVRRRRCRIHHLDMVVACVRDVHTPANIGRRGHLCSAMSHPWCHLRARARRCRGLHWSSTASRHARSQVGICSPVGSRPAGTPLRCHAHQRP